MNLFGFFKIKKKFLYRALMLQLTWGANDMSPRRDVCTRHVTFSVRICVFGHTFALLCARV